MTSYAKTQMTDTNPYYVIRYDNGSYNLDDGYEVKKLEATRYSTYKEAEEQVEGLVGVECIEEVYENEEEPSDTEILEFLLNQFKSHSLQMNGESDWVFMNSGFPMNHAKGQTARDAVINAMRAK
jgi:hypothetical protein